MSSRESHEDLLGRLADELAQRMESGGSLDEAALARQFGVEPLEVAQVRAAVELARGPLVSGAVLGSAPELAAPNLPARYEVVGELGRGGMGVVYRARQVELEREVAVKVLRPGELLFGEAIARFRREAQSLARLRHPHIVRVYEVGEVDGLTWFSMDLCEGGSLEGQLQSGPLSPSHAVRLMKQVASAVAYTHSKSLVHRDLKPANVLLDEEGNALVADFGLARELAGEGSLTQSGALLGTPDYMAPEQARGEREAVGETTDVYALGVLLYECLVGKPPFSGLALIDRIHAVVHSDPPAPRKREPKVPRELELVCLKAMSKEPSRRYPTARAFLEELERFEEGRSVLATPPSAAYRLRRFGQQYRRELMFAPLALATIALVWWFGVRPQFGATPAALADKAVELLEADDPLRAAMLLELGAEEAENRTELEELAAEARVRAVRRAVLAQDLPAALEILRQGLARAPRSPRARRSLQWERASVALALSNRRELLEALQSWLRSHPSAQQADALVEQVLRVFEVPDLPSAGVGGALLAVALNSPELQGSLVGRILNAGAAGRAALCASADLAPWLLDAHSAALRELLSSAGSWSAAPGGPAALAALLRSDLLGTPLRRSAAEALRKASGMPPYGASFSTPTAVLARWQPWAGRSREEALVGWIDEAYERLEQADPERMSTHLLATWLHTHSARPGGGGSRAWWEHSSGKDVRALLAAALGLESDEPHPREVIPFVGDADLERAERAHVLLGLLADERVPLPGRDATREDWRRALGEVDPRPQTLRLAHFAFDRLHPHGELLWQESLQLEAGSAAEVAHSHALTRRDEVFPSVGLPGIGSGQSVHETYRCRSDFDLMRAPGLRGESWVSTRSTHSLEPSKREHSLASGGPRTPGRVQLVQTAFHDDLADAARIVLHATLAVELLDGEDAEAWGREDWARLVRADLMQVSGQRAELRSSGAERQVGLLAQLFASEADIEVLRSFEGEAFLPALALVGDPELGQDEPVVERIEQHFDGGPRVQHEGRWFWTRAFELGAHGDVGAQAYERWVARAQVSLFSGGQLLLLAGYVLAVLTLLGAALRLLVTRSPALSYAPVLIAAGLILASLRLGSGGIDLAPDALGLALALAGSAWLARRAGGRARWAPRLFALALAAELLVLALPGSWVAHWLAGFTGISALFTLPFLARELYRGAPLSARQRAALRPAASPLWYYVGAIALWHLMVLGAAIAGQPQPNPELTATANFALLLFHLPVLRALWDVFHATRCSLGLLKPRRSRGRWSAERGGRVPA